MPRLLHTYNNIADNCDLPGKMGLVVTHEDIFVLDIFEN